MIRIRKQFLQHFLVFISYKIVMDYAIQYNVFYLELLHFILIFLSFFLNFGNAFCFIYLK